MPRQADLYSGGWWKFDRYEIRDGSIVPAEDARLEAYDPWDLYRVARRSGSDKKSPSDEFLSLARRIDYEERLQEGGVVEIHVDGERELLDFCGKYGLLGLLLHQVRSVTTALPAMFKMQSRELIVSSATWYRRAASWEGIRGFETYTEENAQGLIAAVAASGILEEADPTLPPFFGWGPWAEPVSGRHNLVPSSWPLLDVDGVTHETQHLGVNPRLVRETEKGWPANWPQPGVVRQPLAPKGNIFRQGGIVEGPYVIEPIGETWVHYFPALPVSERELFLYPKPLSPEFWLIYGEPVAQFVEAARVVEMAFDDRDLLNRLAEPVEQWLAESEEGEEMRSSFPSLLSSIVTMIMEDRAGPLRRHRCKNCHAPFFSKSWQATYCSVRCRSTAAMRRYREKQRAAEQRNE